MTSNTVVAILKKLCKSKSPTCATIFQRRKCYTEDPNTEDPPQKLILQKILLQWRSSTTTFHFLIDRNRWDESVIVNCVRVLYIWLHFKLWFSDCFTRVHCERTNHVFVQLLLLLVLLLSVFISSGIFKL